MENNIEKKFQGMNLREIVWGIDEYFKTHPLNETHKVIDLRWRLESLNELIEKLSQRNSQSFISIEELR